MSQIRVDATKIKSVNVSLLRMIVDAVAKDHQGGRVGVDARTYSQTSQSSDIGLAYYDNVITRGIAIQGTKGLGFAGDPYGYTTAYHERTAEIQNRYLDADIEQGLRDAQFSVIVQPIGKNGMQFSATDLGGRQAIIIRDGEGKLRTTFEGYAGTDCHDAQQAIQKILAARGIEMETESVQPKSEEKWLEQTLLAMNN